jgi:hypothetical protein
MSQVASNPELSETIFNDAVENNGYLGQPIIDVGYIAPSMPQRVSLEQTARFIGNTIDPIVPTTPKTAVDAWNADTLPHNPNMYAQKISDRLYVARPWLATGTQQVSRIFVPKAIRTASDRRLSHIGVIAHQRALKTLVGSPEFYVDRIGGKTREHHAERPNAANREEEDRKVDSSRAKSMAQKIEKLDVLDAELAFQRSVLVRIYRGLRRSPPIRYRPDNALGLLAMGDKIIRDTVELSGLNQHIDDNVYQPLTSDERAENQRHLNYMLYMSDNPAFHWRELATVAGRHINALRMLTEQSRRVCAHEYSLNSDGILPAERDTFDQIVYPSQLKIS